MNAQKKALLAVDSNIPLDLAKPREIVSDALELVIRRLSPAMIIVPPTVLQELVLISRSGDPEERDLARKALTNLRRLGLEAISVIPVERGIVTAIAEALQRADLLPASEWNDGLILAEAALLGCNVLLTSDGHLRGIDFPKASLILKEFGAHMPVVATPGELLAKFG